MGAEAAISFDEGPSAHYIVNATGSGLDDTSHPCRLEGFG